MNKEIFISHRSTDKYVITELVQFMENIGINSDKIMYTSADYTNAQYDLGPEIKEALTKANVIIVVLSKEYFESVYCCNELGYIWATNKNPIVFGLAGIDSSKDLHGFVNDWIIRRVNNPRHIDFLYDNIQLYSEHDTLSTVKYSFYKDRYLENVNKVLENIATNRKTKEIEIYKPGKYIDLDSLIISNYYGDKELLLFKYILDTNNYIWGIVENLKIDIETWEKKNRLKSFLSNDLESFLIMLTKKGYLKCQVVSRAEYMVQNYVGKNDAYSKEMRILFGADENGETKHNYFEIKEPFYREIIRINEDSINKINECMQKYKLKWYQKGKSKK